MFKKYFKTISILSISLVLLGTVSVFATWPDALNGGNVGGWLGEVFDLGVSDSGKLIIESEKVGIGTNNPLATLYVIGNFEVLTNNISNWAASIYNTNVNGKGLYVRGGSGSADAFHVDDYLANHRFIVKANGNVGIGVDNPTQRLDVNGKIRMQSQTAASDAADTVATKGYVDNKATPSLWTENGANIYRNSGNVGIGTSAPMSKLDVNGSIALNGRVNTAGAESTYGSLTVNGSKNNWSGINFKNGGTNLGTLMVQPDYQGFYNNSDNGWDWYWTNGVLSVGSVPWARITGAPAMGGGLSLGSSIPASTSCEGFTLERKSFSLDGNTISIKYTDQNNCGPYRYRYYYGSSWSSCLGGYLDCDCFIAGTQIEMADNTAKNIEDVRVGDMVKTVNTKTMEVENKPVLSLLSQYHTGKGDDFTVLIKFSNGKKNQNTNSHPYYVKGKGWASYRPDITKKKYNLEVAQLEVDDTVYEINENKLQNIKIVELVERREGVQTYNLSSIEDNQDFFANGILVHNKYY